MELDDARIGQSVQVTYTGTLPNGVRIENRQLQGTLVTIDRRQGLLTVDASNAVPGADRLTVGPEDVEPLSLPERQGVSEGDQSVGGRHLYSILCDYAFHDRGGKLGLLGVFRNIL